MSMCVARSTSAIGPGPPIRPSLFRSTPNASSTLFLMKSREWQVTTTRCDTPAQAIRTHIRSVFLSFVVSGSRYVSFFDVRSMDTLLVDGGINR